DVALGADLDEDLGVFALPAKVVSDRTQLVQVMGTQAQAFPQVPIALLVPQAIEDLGVFQNACRGTVAGQLVDRLQNDPYGPVLFSDRLVIELHALQHMVELELFGKLIEEDDPPLRTVSPNGP